MINIPTQEPPLKKIKFSSGHSSTLNLSTVVPWVSDTSNNVPFDNTRAFLNPGYSSDIKNFGVRYNPSHISKQSGEIVSADASAVFIVKPWKTKSLNNLAVGEIILSGIDEERLFSSDNFLTAINLKSLEIKIKEEHFKIVRGTMKLIVPHVDRLIAAKKLLVTAKKTAIGHTSAAYKTLMKPKTASRAGADLDADLKAINDHEKLLRELTELEATVSGLEKAKKKMFSKNGRLLMFTEEMFYMDKESLKVEIKNKPGVDLKDQYLKYGNALDALLRILPKNILKRWKVCGVVRKIYADNASRIVVDTNGFTHIHRITDKRVRSGNVLVAGIVYSKLNVPTIKVVYGKKALDAVAKLPKTTLEYFDIKAMKIKKYHQKNVIGDNCFILGRVGNISPSIRYASTAGLSGYMKEGPSETDDFTPSMQFIV